MRESVKAVWPAVCTKYEGRCSWLYLDTKKLPTTGLGYRVVNHASMQSLPWYNKDNELATPKEITAEWDWINGNTKLAPKGGFAFKAIAHLYLKDDEIDRLLFVTTDSFWSILLKSLPDLESWPADAQLALMDQAWNMGPYFVGSSWPNFTKAAKAADFKNCAKNCLSKNKSPRDYFHQSLYNNAVKVVSLKLDPEIYWGNKTPSKSVPSAPVEPTVPDKEPEPTIPTTPVVNVKHSNTYDCDYVWYGKGGGHSGGWVPVNLVEVLDAVASETGKPIYLSQGGLNGTVSASAKTHMGLGAFDIAIDGRSKAKVWELAAALLRSGIVAFPRGYVADSFQNMKHIHCCSWDNMKNLHPQAQAQVNEYRKGGDGLVGSRSYTGPTTQLEHWSTSPYNPKNIKEVGGILYVQTATLLGLDVDRKSKNLVRSKGYALTYVKQVKRWDRWNAVTDSKTYYAIADDSQVYLAPLPEVLVPTEPTIEQLRDGTRGN